MAATNASAEHREDPLIRIELAARRLLDGVGPLARVRLGDVYVQHRLVDALVTEPGLEPPRVHAEQRGVRPEGVTERVPEPFRQPKGAGDSDSGSANTKTHGHGGDDKDVGSASGHDKSKKKKEAQPGDDDGVPLSEFTHLQPSMAQQYVRIDARAGTVTLDQEKANHDLIGKPFHNGRHEVRILAMSAGQVQQDAGVIEYTIFMKVQSDDQRLPITVEHRYVFQTETGESTEFGGIDGMDLMKKVNAAVSVHGDTASLTSNTTFTTGPYTITIMGANDVRDEPAEHGAKPMTLVTLDVKFDKITTSNGKGIVHTVDGIKLVHEGSRAFMRVPVERK